MDFSEQENDESWPGHNILHPKNFLINLNRLRSNNELCDVSLRASGEFIPAHKVVLSACSPYFHAMFNGQFPESNLKEIDMPYIDAGALKILVDYMYTSYIELTSENVQAILEVASFLQIIWVRDVCCQLLENELDIWNCIGMKRLADRLSCVELSVKAKRYIMKNFHFVSTMDEFLTLEIEELNELLQNEDIFFHTDNVVFHAVMKWMNHHPDLRLTHLRQILTKINPSLVDKHSLASYSILQDNISAEEWYNKANAITDMEWNIFILDKMGKASDVLRYGVKTKLQIPLESQPSKAFGMSLIAYKNLLCIQGGEVQRNSMQNCFLYDVYRNRWAEYTPLLYSRSHHRSCIIDDAVFTFGGQNQIGALDSCECIDITTGKRSTLSPMLGERSSFGAAVHNNCIYVMGGEKPNKLLRTLERYDSRIGTWESLSAMNQACSYCSSAVVSDYLYCSEGLGLSMERYDFRNDSWELIDYKRQTETFEMFAFENKLFNISSQGVFNFNFEKMDWTPLFYFPSLREWDTAVALEMIIT